MSKNQMTGTSSAALPDPAGCGGRIAGVDFRKNSGVALARFFAILFLLTLPMANLSAQDSLQEFDHGDPTAHEQLMLELINRARADPKKEAKRLEIDLNAGLRRGTINTKPKPPLAFHPDLIEAARQHSRWMLENNKFSHTGKNGSSEHDRVRQSGYPLGAAWSIGENIGWGGTTGSVEMTENVRARHKGLFESPQHRINIFREPFQEVGLGIFQGKYTYNDSTFNAVMVTQKFAVSSGTPSPLITGVVHQDADKDKFYTPGEGLEGVTVRANPGNWVTKTSKSGGYALPYRTDLKKVSLSFSGGDLPKALTVNVKLTGKNVKQDARR